MNPWLRGLWDTIHFRHRCESLAAFGRRFQAESEERMERVGGLREKCIAWMYVLMFGVCLLTPLRAALAWNPVHLLCNLSSFGALCSQFFPPITPFVSEWDDNLVCWSHLKNHGSLISLQCCSAALPPAAPWWKLPMTRHVLKCTMHMHAHPHTNKRTPNYKHRFATVKLQWRMMISLKRRRITDKQIFHSEIKHPPCENVYVCMMYQESKTRYSNLF